MKDFINHPLRDTETLTGSSISHAIFSVSILFFLFSLSGCTSINKWRSRTLVPISGPIEIGSKWIEIVSPSPLVSRSGTNQHVEFFFEQDFIDNWGGEDYKTLRLRDGKMTKLDVFLYDDVGKEYQLFINGGGRSSVRFTYNNPATKGYEDFPNGVYIKLKVKSEISVKIEKIEWNASYSIDNAL